jgi:hypothetical protein
MLPANVGREPVALGMGENRRLDAFVSGPVCGGHPTP